MLAPAAAGAPQKLFLQIIQHVSAACCRHSMGARSADNHPDAAQWRRLWRRARFPVLAATCRGAGGAAGATCAATRCMYSTYNACWPRFHGGWGVLCWCPGWTTMRLAPRRRDVGSDPSSDTRVAPALQREQGTTRAPFDGAGRVWRLGHARCRAPPHSSPSSPHDHSPPPPRLPPNFAFPPITCLQPTRCPTTLRTAAAGVRCVRRAPRPRRTASAPRTARRGCLPGASPTTSPRCKSRDVRGGASPAAAAQASRPRAAAGAPR